MSEITLKIKYNSDNPQRILEMIKNYNSIFGLTYNFMFENEKSSTKSILSYVNSKNNLFLDTYFKNGAIYDCKSEISRNKNKKIVFGGKKLFFDRQKNLISKEEYKIKKLRPLNVVGAAYNKGNCKFQIVSENEILFKPNAKEHFNLKLKNVGKNYQKKLKQLILIQEKCEIPISYKLGAEYVYVSFDNDKIENFKKVQKKKNRVFAIDMNPNYIGWSVVDWKDEKTYHIVDSEVISLKDLNDFENNLNVSSDSKEKKYVTNKRKYEVIQIAYELCKKANHYHCELFAIEDLNMRSSNKEKGRKYNKLCNNQWCRGILVSILQKLCDLYEIKLQKVQAAFSSFEGNLIYREERLPDMCLSSIEIGRRAYEFYHQYVLKDKKQEKNIIFDKLENVKEKVEKSLEELDYLETWESLSDLYYKLKKAKCKYRFSVEEAQKAFINSFSSKKDIKSYKNYYSFY